MTDPTTGVHHPQSGRWRALTPAIVASAALFLAALPAKARHDKTDIITVEDGGVYIGEIKGVKSATLSLKTSAAGTMQIEWRFVTGLESDYVYRIESEGGYLHFGTLAKADEPGKLRVVSTSESADLPLVDVVTILPMEESVTGRLDGSVSFGLTYTQANSSLQYNLSADVSYRTRKNSLAFTGQSIFDTQKDGATTNQHYSNLIASQVIGGGWGAFEVGQLQSNPDQGYDLRLILGGGGTHFFKEDSRVQLQANLGIVYNREKVTGSSEVDESAEILLGMGYRRFKDSSHSPLIRLALNTFSDPRYDRFRFSLTSEISWKVVSDLTVNFQFNDIYDSSPPGEDANKNDLSFVTSLGVTF